MPIQYALIAEGDDVLAEEPATARNHAAVARQIISKIERKNQKRTLTQNKFCTLLFLDLYLLLPSMVVLLFWPLVYMWCNCVIATSYLGAYSTFCVEYITLIDVSEERSFHDAYGYRLS